MKIESIIGLTIVLLLAVDVWLTYQMYLGRSARSGV